ncbi:MAG: hypothetical protein HY615_14835 [Candidatus Rokubacteria bacterium]|nr:hypothetical protein [Candidatus Rokubacteria bacterium]
MTKWWSDRIREERGVALVLALMVLLTLTGLVLAFLSVSAFEPQISRNQSDTARARYVAEAGVEYAYNELVTNSTIWDTYLAGATCSQGAVLGSANSTLPGLTSAAGTFTVRVRNDCQAGDDKITGVAVESSGNATDDTNDHVIVVASGTLGNATRSITTVVKKTPVPPMNGALSFPGLQADINFSGSAFTIDGRDYLMSDAPGSPTGTADPVYGIAVNDSLPALETQVESALAGNQDNSIYGKSESGTPPGSGNDAINTDSTLTSTSIADFVNALKQYADITINTSPGNTHSISSVGSSCASSWSSSTCWGTTAKPKVVYVNGTLPDLTTQYTSLDISGTSQGTGILIVENGNVDISGNFHWNGPIIVTGNNVGIRYAGGGSQSVYGSVVVNELNDDGTANVEGDVRGNASMLYSRQALQLVEDALSRRLVTSYSWTDQ